MGELLLCREPMAALPYYVEGMGMNLYSMEELCYYIAGNTYLLGASFMSEDLCGWVEHEMGLYKLAEQLRAIQSLPEFVAAILNDCGYYGPKETEEIVHTVRQMEQKSDFECGKLRADRLMEQKKYISSIYEYRRLLEAEDKGAGALLAGAVWHNLGTAYARLFLFGEASAAYDNAYRLNQLPESLNACLMCYLCLSDEDGFRKKAKEHHYDEEKMQKLKDDCRQAGIGGQMADLEAHLREIEALKEQGQKTDAKKAVSDMIFQWKEDYRRNCRM